MSAITRTCALYFKDMLVRINLQTFHLSELPYENGTRQYGQAGRQQPSYEQADRFQMETRFFKFLFFTGRNQPSASQMMLTCGGRNNSSVLREGNSRLFPKQDRLQWISGERR